MAKRGKSARAQVPLRIPESLRARAEHAANRNGTSMNAEISARLEASFAKEDAAGGPEMLAIMELVRNAFLLGGRLGAVASKHPEWTTAEWINDPFCLEAAISAAMDALVIIQARAPYQSAHPDPQKRELHQQIHTLFAQLTAQGKPITHVSGKTDIKESSNE